MKICKKCGELKSLDEFIQHPKGKFYCRPCWGIACRRQALVRRYGITWEQYEEMFTAQGGVCVLCHRPPKKNRLHVDHDPVTGKVRGLLCASCNTTLGKILCIIGGLGAIRAYLDR